MKLTYLKEVLGQMVQSGQITVKENEMLKEYSSFRIGGSCDLVIHPQNGKALVALVALLKECQVNYKVLGNASNVLFSDKGYRGAIIFTTAMQDFTIEDITITASAGLSFTALAVKARNEGLSGLEFAYGIPGTVGGAVYMNAGAYGGSVSDHLVSSRYYDPTENKIVCLEGNEHNFGYRHSAYMENGGIILDATFSLIKADKEIIGEKMKELMDSRRTKQPLEYPSAGSVFKRPEGYFAGKLIEDAGLKGYTIGGAQVSEKHAGFIINRGSATAEDVENLIAHIQKTVWENFGVKLETEIIRMGESGV